MKILKKMFLTYFLMLVIFTNSFGFYISSENFDQRIDTGGYKEFILKNNSDTTVRYKFEVKKGNGNKDMSKWVTLYPKVMSIPPMQERVLKIHAQSPAGAEEGEYSFNLLAKPIVVPTIKEEDGTISGTGILPFVPVIEMLGYVGDANFEKKINLKDIKLEEGRNKEIILTGVIENNSFAGMAVGLNFVSWNDTVIDGQYIGRIPKNKNSRIKVKLNKTVEKTSDIKKIIIYNAVTLKNIKAIEF